MLGKSIKYLPHVDGLRAVAVLMVIFYHLDLPGVAGEIFKNGFYGVDVFFVISGFLITGLLCNEYETFGRVSLLDFYDRRARRLLPMLLTLLLVLLPVGWLVLLPSSFTELSESAIASLTFLSNIYFYSEYTQYGVGDAFLQPLLHTWSLAIEEQFYLLYPLLFVLAVRVRYQLLPFLLMAITVGSLWLAIFRPYGGDEFAFYIALPRVWELSIGGLAFVLTQQSSVRQLLSRCGYLVWPAIALFVYVVMIAGGIDYHPDFNTVLVVFCVTVIILCGKHSKLVNRLLSSKIMVIIGRASYSLYLWHFSIFSLMMNAEVFVSIQSKVIAMVVVVLLTVVSYRYIELPLRYKTSKLRVYIFIAASYALLLFGYSAVVNLNGVPSRFDIKLENHKTMSQYREDFIRNNDFFVNGGEAPRDFDKSERRKNIFVMGDSHGHGVGAAISLDRRTRVQYKHIRPACDEFIVSGYLKVDKHTAFYKSHCNEMIGALGKIPKNTDILILADSQWSDSHYSDIEHREAFELLLSTLRESYSGQIVFVRGRPLWSEWGYRLLYKLGGADAANNLKVQEYLEYSYRGLKDTESVFEAHYKEYDVGYLSLIDGFCDPEVQICKLFGRNTLYFSDKDHMTLEGAEFVSKFLVDRLLHLTDPEEVVN
jgi:peptidoglycan/LPS O-acetylase OafA/YrhL